MLNFVYEFILLFSGDDPSTISSSGTEDETSDDEEAMHIGKTDI